MKKENIVKYVAAIAGKLLLITLVVALALAAVNSVTAPVIAKLKAEKLQAAIGEVLPGGGEAVAFDAGSNPLVTAAYKGDNGYAIQVTPAGFGGAITMMVGVDSEGKVLGISVVSQAETAGLGAIIAAKTSAGEDFRGQFLGGSGTIAVTKDGGTIDSLTGATITSRAVCVGVNAALSCAAGLG